MIDLNKKSSSRPTFSEEKKLWDKSFKYVIGVDEVGRGAFAGPVTTAAVIFPVEFAKDFLELVNDSKMLSPEKRQMLSPLIKSNLTFSISTVSVSKINKVGIGKATEIAFRHSVSNIMKKILNQNGNSKIINLKSEFFLLVDGFHIKYVKGIGLKNQNAIIGGDKKSLTIAAASIVAKVHRDNLMIKLSKLYPEYKFDINKGYGTEKHRMTIKKYGLTRIHRPAFCKNLTSGK